MNKDQLQYFVKSESIPVTIGVHDISNTPRTLLYGDLEFCKKLRSLGAVLKFSHYLEPDRQGPFYGRLR